MSKAQGQETPLMRQYREIKSQHADAVLFFRMGDFYEMFFDDAKLAARVLGLTLTTRNNGGASRVPLAGVPVKAANRYLRELVDNGHRVAICEQIEDPKLAKGVVKRSVVETITPGSVLNHEWLDNSRNNFLVAVKPAGTGAARAGRAGLAALDLSTGEFQLETAAPADLVEQLLRFDPREMVVPEGKAPDKLPEIMITERAEWDFDAKFAREDLTRRFGISSLDGLGITERETPALEAAGALLKYLAELQPGGLPHLARPVLRSGDSTMLLDEMTRINLELVESMDRTGHGSTLFEVLDHTMTPMGARLLRNWILAPLVDFDRITKRQDAVQLLLEDQRSRSRLREALHDIRDMARLAGRCASRRASPRDLGALRNSLVILPDVKSALDGVASRERSAELERIAESFELFASLRATLEKHLVDRPPAQLGKEDTIRSGADARLDEARALRDGGKGFIASLQAKERERTGIQTLRVGYNRVFGYYIEVTKTHRDRVPEDYERRQTLTNSERYATPLLKEYEAKVLGAEEEVAKLESELVERLLELVEGEIEQLHRQADLLAHLDVYAALALVAERNDYARPRMSQSFELRLEGARHPVIETLMPQGSFIPNDIVLDLPRRVMLITGPNMAGKSTILRQVGLVALMAQTGSFVPASAATIGVVDRIFTRVGASDNLGRGQSTFMVEMNETGAILNCATDRSLVLLDEIGRGTSTYDGVAIAWAVTEYLHDRIGCKTVFATHYHELTQLTEQLEHLVNMNVAVKEAGEEIVFLHRLEPGGADRSYGIHVARLAGLPTSVIERARNVLHILESEHHVAGMPAPAPAPPDDSQLALFETHPVLKELEELDPNNMTPLEALERLARLKQRLDK